MKEKVRMSEQNKYIYIIIALILFLIYSPSSVLAQSAIINNADATYTDEAGKTFPEVQSGEVRVPVARGYGVTIRPPAIVRLGAPQNYLPFPHIVRNTGNGPDTFLLSLSGSFPPGFTGDIYWDRNRNGIVNPGEPLITETNILAPGEDFYIVALIFIPLNAPVNTNVSFTVTAVSSGDPSPNPATAQANDALTVVAGAILDVSKTVTPGGLVNRGDILEYEIVVSNIGEDEAESVYVRDPLPEGTSFVRNSLTLNQLPVTDASDGDGGTLTANEAVFFIQRIPHDQSAVVTFKVQVLEDMNLREVINTANIEYVDVKSGETYNTQSNPAIVNVILPEYILVPDNASTTTPGRTVFYTHTITNNGNVRDAYDILISSSLGYDVKIYIDRNGDGRLQADEPEVFDTNGDGVPDTGFLEPGQSMSFIVRVPVPLSATIGDVDVTTITSISRLDPNEVRTVTDTTTVKPAIAGVIVDDITGLPVAGAVITVTNAQGEVVGTAVTGEDGSYFIPVDAIGVYNVNITYEDENGNVFNHTVQAVVDENTSVAYPLSCIAGTVTDKDTGEPISGCTLLIERIGDSPTEGTPEGIVVPVPGLNTSQTIITVLPVTLICDDRGDYIICGLLTGLYRVSIQRADGYDYVGIINLGDISTLGQILINVDLQLRRNTILRITKKADIPSGEIGDIVTYLIEVENTDDERTALDVQIVDTLPFGFQYAEGSSLFNGEPFPDPIGPNPLIWNIGNIPPQTTYTITYSVILGAGVTEGVSENIASVYGSTPTGTPISAGPAKAGVRVTESMFYRNSGVLMGKVYEDLNCNGKHDDEEPGIAGVALYLDDGTKIVTGDDGKYSVPDVRAGTHAIRLDETSLDPVYTATVHETDQGDDALLQFVYIPKAGLGKANFSVRKTVDIPPPEGEE